MTPTFLVNSANQMPLPVIHQLMRDCLEQLKDNDQDVKQHKELISLSYMFLIKTVLERHTIPEVVKMLEHVDIFNLGKERSN